MKTLLIYPAIFFLTLSCQAQYEGGYHLRPDASSDGDTDGDAGSDSDTDSDTDADPPINWTIPPTGQGKCYNDSGEITCPGTAGSSSCGTTDFCGQDAQYPTTRIFTVTTVSGKKLVEDSATGLIWTQEFETGKTWQQAVDYCDALDYGGHTDWRLPSPIELATITNLGTYSPAIDATAFPGTPSEWFWSSSSYANATSNAWIVLFPNGHGYNDVKFSTYDARCVCSRPLKIGSFEPLVISSERVVKDLGTGLMWQGCVAGQSGTDCTGTATDMTWKDALSYCEGLSWAGHDDWRLPNAHELQSIVDYGKSNPAIDTTAFPNAPNSDFWSSSSNAFSTSYAWFVNFVNGVVNFHDKFNTRYARCVCSSS